MPPNIKLTTSQKVMLQDNVRFAAHRQCLEVLSGECMGASSRNCSLRMAQTVLQSGKDSDKLNLFALQLFPLLCKRYSPCLLPG
jgi:hypothetical protein